MVYRKKGTAALEEVQTTLRMKELTKFNNLKVDDIGEGLSVLRGRCGSIGNQANSKVGDKLKDKRFKCHKIGHFKRGRSELVGNDDSAIFVITLEDYEDASTLAVSCRED
jgi:hypothetical protein